MKTPLNPPSRRKKYGLKICIALVDQKLRGLEISTFKCFYVVGDTKSGPPRGKTIFWRTQMALYLVGRVRPSPVMEVVTKGVSSRL